jgi:bacteriophage protein
VGFANYTPDYLRQFRDCLFYLKGNDMLKTVCIKCNRKLKQGERCSCNSNRHREYDRFIRDEKSKQFYHSKEWGKLTTLCKSKCNGLDIYELYENNKIVKGELSHHIVPVEDDAGKKFDIGNLIYVSHKTHNFIHSVYARSKEEKKALQTKLFDYLLKIKKI